MAKFVLQDGESVIQDDKGMWLKSKLQGFGARMCLTDRRLVIAQRGIPALGLIGMLFNKEGSVRVEVSKSDIAGIEQSSHGRAKNVVEISTKDGKAHRFIPGIPFETWKTALDQWSQA
ncbi:MAG: hypothetical protein K0V04_30075 [Deltaproteobacteria bacterium]|nr:hypothetical protein [Deltaproteobacteria bacterium]